MQPDRRTEQSCQQLPPVGLSNTSTVFLDIKVPVGVLGFGMSAHAGFSIPQHFPTVERVPGDVRATGGSGVSGHGLCGLFGSSATVPAGMRRWHK